MQCSSTVAPRTELYFLTCIRVTNGKLGIWVVVVVVVVVVDVVVYMCTESDHFLHTHASGVCHQADVPPARDSVEREGASAGGAERTQRAPGRVHGDQRGRLAHHPEQQQPDSARGHRQAAAHAQHRPPQGAHEDRE